MLRLESRDNGGFQPEYEGIDFLTLRLAKLAIMQLDRVEYWIVCDEDNEVYEQQVNQNNTVVEQNQVLDALDRICFKDERDDSWWVYYREEIPNFDQVAEQVGIFAYHVSTLYPTPEAAKNYFARRDSEIEEL